MIREPLHILYLAGDSDDAQRVRTVLNQAGLDFRMQVATTGDKYLSALKEHTFDLILANEKALGFDSVPVLETARRRYPDIPFIFAAESASERLQAPSGATSGIDGALKCELERLAPAIKRALQQPAAQATQRWLTAPHSHAAEHLVSAVQQLALARELRGAMSIACQAARALTGADGATFTLREGEYCRCAAENAVGPLWKDRSFPMTSSISGWAMLNRQSIAIEDIYSDARIVTEAYYPTFVKSLVMVPIRTAAPVGAIGSYWATRHRASPEEVERLQALADNVSIVMENIRLSKCLRTLSQHLLETAEDERRQFAQQLHDAIGQPLMAIQINLQTNAQRSEALSPQPLQASIELVERLCQEVQKLSLELYPALLDDLGLVYALTWHLRQATQYSGLRTRLHTDLGNHRFGQEIEIVCFRVAQEAIRNVVAHAMAQSLTIELGQHNGRLYLSVADDGIGFDTSLEPHNPSFGLLGMQERASLIGGEVQMTSVPGQGTCIRGYFPLKGTRMAEISESGGQGEPGSCPTSR